MVATPYDRKDETWLDNTRKHSLDELIAMKKRCVGLQQTQACSSMTSLYCMRDTTCPPHPLQLLVLCWQRPA